MLKRLFLLLCYLLFPLTISASDQPPTLPSYQPGDTFIFSNQRVERVVSYQQGQVQFASRRGHLYQRSANFILPVSQQRLAGHEQQSQLFGDADQLWPLRTGARVRFRLLHTITRADAKQSRQQLELWGCRVDSPQWLAVSAGQFETIPIHCERYSEQSMALLLRKTWYYAPQLGHYVRVVESNFASGEQHDYQLLAALYGRQANPQRIRAVLREPQ